MIEYDFLTKSYFSQHTNCEYLYLTDSIGHLFKAPFICPLKGITAD